MSLPLTTFVFMIFLTPGTLWAGGGMSTRATEEYEPLTKRIETAGQKARSHASRASAATEHQRDLLTLQTARTNARLSHHLSREKRAAAQRDLTNAFTNVQQSQPYRDPSLWYKVCGCFDCFGCCDQGQDGTEQ